MANIQATIRLPPSEEKKDYQTSSKEIIPSEKNKLYDVDVAMDTTVQLQSGEPSQPLDSAQMSRLREVFFVMSICIGQFMTLAPLGQVLAPLRIIGRSFHETSVSSLSWYLAGYALTLGTFILIGGGLGDRYGYKRLFLVGLAWLGCWTFVAGFTVYTGSEVFFDICRAMQGLGSAIVTPNALAILGATYSPGAKKAVLFCLFGVMGPAGFFISTIVSTLLAQLAWWPWTFWIASIVALVLSVMAYISIPAHLMHSSVHHGADGELPYDWLGSITGPSGLILFNVAWNQAPVSGWSSPYVIILLVLAVAAMAAFVFIERRAEAPIVPIQDLKAGVVLVLSCVFFGWSSFGIFLYYWFQFVEVLQDQTPLGAVARHTPAPIFALIAAGIVAAFVTKVRSCWIMFGAEVAFVTANILLATLDPRTTYWKQELWTVIIIPFGMDMTYPAASLMLSDLVQQKHQGMAASLVATMANYSVALGLGIAGTVEVHFNDGGANVLAGYRSAMYTACGLAGTGLLISIYSVVLDYARPNKGKPDTV